MNERHLMERFFSPRSVVIVGASNRPFNLGSTICSLLKTVGYDGAVYAVNSSGENVAGFPGYPSVSEIPFEVDLAVVLVPARHVPDVARQCAEKGIKNLIIESAGFAEEGAEGARLQSRLDDIVTSRGTRYLGPNCLGTLSSKDRFCCFFGVSSGSTLIESIARQGVISYVIQSGGVAGLVLESLQSDVEGVNKVVCIGNKADVDEADLIDYFEGDGTEVIGMYLENVPRGRKFYEAALRSTKPILVYKVGRTREGVLAASSHTAGMANDNRIFETACRQAGVIGLRSVSELHALPKIFTTMPLLRGRNVAVFTNSGAFGGICADLLVENGLGMAVLSAETQSKLKKAGHLFNAANPIDLGPGLSKQTYLDIYEILLSAPEVDGLLPITSLWQDFIIDSLVDLGDLCRKYAKPAAVYVPNAIKKVISIRERRGVPLFESPEEAVRALAVSSRFWEAVHSKCSGKIGGKHQGARVKASRDTRVA